jgi:hypothetical protein
MTIGQDYTTGRTGLSRGGGRMRQHIVYTSLPSILYPRLKKAGAPPVEFCTTHKRTPTPCPTPHSARRAAFPAHHPTHPPTPRARDHSPAQATPLGGMAYNGRVERSRCAGDEAFYLPCVLSLDTGEAFLDAGLGWLYHYNYERVHSGYGMEGRKPYGCCVALGFGGSSYVGLMPVVLLGNIVLDWSREGVPAVNDVLAHYTALAGARRPRPC